MRQTRKRFRWPFISLAALLILAACAAAGGSVVEPVVSVSEQSDDPIAPTPQPIEPTETPAKETAVPETETETKTETEIETGPKIFTEDNRSDRLRSLTDHWGTNWSLRTIDYDEILSGGPPRDGIPSIDDPQFISPDDAGEWLADNEPVIFLERNGDARAYPLQILTWHEIANDTVGGEPVVVTFCPLCNSALVFDRRLDGEAVEFGTSGLLRNSDLIMYDRKTESLWQQFTGDAIVGDKVGERLTFIPSSLISFADFRAAHPDGKVLSQQTGFSRRYGENPYVGYDSVQQNPFLYDGPLDERLLPMTRVVTISLDEVDAAYPVDILAEAGVIHDTQGGQEMVLFHKAGTASALDTRVIADGDDVGATAVFDPNLNGQKLTFSQAGDDFIDAETGSVWNILGQGIDGPLAGEQLTPIVHADHFWFSWAAFRPDTVIYTGEG
ncbi:MAG: DUF3179 domain-containing protein [Chloroflexi bacterium]|nr:DUF3179 domain-containing protein [Chloroflexota bacterium]